MSVTAMIEISVIAVLALAVAALSFRLLKLRNGGTAALLRDMPEVGEGRWRHGVMGIASHKPSSIASPVCGSGPIASCHAATWKSSTAGSHAVTSTTS
ncbi:Protein of uncharacterised function (DUF2550) [Mycobacteroides abscessus]|nr:Protein of uncharacterised function (DUF2550) [Mycobacteroides abscessus]